MDTAEMIALCKQHTIHMDQRRSGKPCLSKGRGIYMYTPSGEQVIDFNSQLMCANIGHGHPKVRAAMKAQIDQLTYVTLVLRQPFGHDSVNA